MVSLDFDSFENKFYMKYFLFLLAFFTFSFGYSQCDTPANLGSSSGLNGGLNEVSLSWDAVLGAELYSVSYRVFGSDDSFSIKNTNANSTIISGLPATTTYEWKVRAVCEPDWSSVSVFSSLDFFTTSSGGSCTAPINLQSVSTGSGSSINSTTLSWDAVGAAVYYSVAYRIQGNASFTFKTVNTNSLKLDGLPASTNYEWKVRAICASDWSVSSAFSSLEAFTSGTGISCTTPSGVNISNVDEVGGSFTVAWNSVPSAIQFYIQYRIVGEQDWANADYRFTYQPNSKTIPDLQLDKLYEVRMLSICAVDAGGKWTSYSDYSNVVSFDTYQCSTPTNLSSAPGESFVVLNWEAKPGALFYQIKYRESGTAAYLNNLNTADGITTSVQIDGLNPDTNYDWIIRTRCDVSSSGNNSVYSAVQTFTTTAGTPCTTPDGFLSTPTSNDALIEWNAVPSTFNYQLKWREQGQGSFLNSAYISHPTTNYTISGLTSSTTYEWLIRAICEIDGSISSDYSSIQTFTTNAGASCDTPTGLSASPAATSATLSWDAMGAASQYRLKYRVLGAGSFTNTVIITAPTNSTNISGLSANTTYEWLIRTECGFGNSAYTSIQTFSTLSSRSAGTESARAENNTTDETAEKSSPDRNTQDTGEHSTTMQSEFSSFKLLDDSREQLVSIYPNPSYGLVNIELSKTAEVSIYNSKGQLIVKSTYDGGNHNLDLQSYTRGIYYFILEGDDFRKVERIILK